MGLTATRALGSVILLLIGMMLGIGVDRALFAPRSERDPGTEALPVVPEPPIVTAESGTESTAQSVSAGSNASRKAAPLGDVERSIREILEHAMSPQRARRIEEVCSLIAPEDIPAALEKLERLLRREPELGAILTTLGARWVERDPDGALAAAQDIKKPMMTSVLFGLVGALARTDPGSAKEFLPTLYPGFRNALARHFVETWASYDISSAVAWVTELPEGSMKQCTLQGVIGQWARSDARAAASYFESLPAGSRSQGLLSQVAGVWASRNPSEAWAWALKLPQGQRRSGVLRTIVSVWARDDPESASISVADLPSDVLPGDRAAALGAIASSWAAIDTEQAAKWFFELSPGMVSETGIRSICIALAEANPDSAVELLSGIPPGPARNSAVVDVARTWAHEDIGGALAWVEELSGVERSSALGQLIAVWAESDAQAVVAYARGLPPGETRAAVLGTLVPALAAEDPEAAAALIDGFPEDRDMSALSLLNEWVDVDPARAGAWATNLPEGSIRQEALSRIASSWSALDQRGAEGWLSNLPPGPSRDSAIHALVGSTAHQDPGLASTWAARIDELGARTVALELVGRTWLAIDPDRARQWITRSPLPDDMKTQLLDPAQ